MMVRLGCGLQLVHHCHEDDAVKGRLPNAFSGRGSRRDVLFDRRQQLRRGEHRIDVEFVIEELRVDAFRGVVIRLAGDCPSTALQMCLMALTSSFLQEQTVCLMDLPLPNGPFGATRSGHLRAKGSVEVLLRLALGCPKPVLVRSEKCVSCVS